MRSLCALERRSGAAEENCLIGNTFFCLAGVVTNTKYVHIYLQQQLWEHSAVHAAEAKSFETSMFQHKFHVSDKKIQSSQIPLNFSVPPLTYHSSPRPEHLTGEDLSVSK